jgi:hypothetical protein
VWAAVKKTRNERAYGKDIAIVGGNYGMHADLLYEQLEPDDNTPQSLEQFVPAKKGPRSIKPDEGLTPDMGEETEASPPAHLALILDHYRQSHPMPI